MAGTCDTKGAELAYVRQIIDAEGVLVSLVDLSTSAQTSAQPSCQVAEHCWDPVGLAIADYAYRFQHLLAAPG